jgi:hypothetical protein
MPEIQVDRTHREITRLDAIALPMYHLPRRIHDFKESSVKQFMTHRFGTQGMGLVETGRDAIRQNECLESYGPNGLLLKADTNWFEQDIICHWDFGGGQLNPDWTALVRVVREELGRPRVATINDTPIGAQSTNIQLKSGDFGLFRVAVSPEKGIASWDDKQAAIRITDIQISGPIPYAYLHTPAQYDFIDAGLR